MNKDKMLTNGIQEYIKRMIYHYQVGHIPGMQDLLSILKSTSYITLIKKIISIDIEKAFAKIQHTFIIKTLKI